MRRSAWRALPRPAFGCLLVLAIFAAGPKAALAGNIAWPQESDLFMSGSNITLKISAGSQADNLVVNTATFTVTVASGERFTVRYPGPNPGRLANDGGYDPCRTTAGSSDVIIDADGPKTVTFTPAAAPTCGGGGSGAVTPPALSVTVSTPNGGETLESGKTSPIVWSSSGSGISGMRISLSTDSGATFPTVIVANTANDGSYEWQVPSMTTTAKARVKVEALGSNGTALASDASNADFTIQGTAPAPTEPPAEQPPAAPAVDATASGAYSPSAALSATPSIDVDKELELPPDVTPKCTAGTTVKLSNEAAVYYCGKDGKRYVFTNAAVYSTWFADFSGVIVIAPDVMADIPLGGNVTYRPGVRMVKITTDPKVYAVSRGGLLRWVKDEAVAGVLYGADWNKKIDDVPDSFFVNYRIGDPIESAS